jgi:hypothetical protein
MMRGEHHVPAALPPPPLDRMLCRSRAGPRTGNRNPLLGDPIHGPVAVLAERVYRLSSHTVLDLINQKCVAMFRNQIKGDGPVSMHIRTAQCLIALGRGRSRGNTTETTACREQGTSTGPAPVTRIYTSLLLLHVNKAVNLTLHLITKLSTT